MISANIVIKTIIIVPVQKLVVMVVLELPLLQFGYVVRNLNAVFRTEPICQKDSLRVLLPFAMVRTLLGIMERTTSVVLVSVAIGRSITMALVILRINVATGVSNGDLPLRIKKG